VPGSSAITTYIWLVPVADAPPGARARRATYVLGAGQPPPKPSHGQAHARSQRHCRRCLQYVFRSSKCLGTISIDSAMGASSNTFASPSQWHCLQEPCPNVVLCKVGPLARRARQPKRSQAGQVHSSQPIPTSLAPSKFAKVVTCNSYDSSMKGSSSAATFI
jgi:hypothetical protein